MATTLGERVKLALAGPPKQSQVALAKACGIHPVSVNDWVHDRTQSIEGANLLAAAAFLHVNPKWLADGIGPMRSPAEAVDESFGGRGGNVVAVPVVGGVLIDQASFDVDPKLGSGFVLGAGVHDGYAVKIIGSGPDKSLRDGQYLVIERFGNPHFSDYCIVEREGERQLAEVLGGQDGRVTLEAIVTGERFTLTEEDLSGTECVVAVVSASRWRAEAPDPQEGLRPRSGRGR